MGINFDEVMRRLKTRDPRFEEYENAGVKVGGKKMVLARGIHHPDINGSPQALAILYVGKKQPLFTGVVRQIIRRFSLPEDFFD